MPLSQAPSTTPTFPSTISPPYDGDPLSATQLRTDDLTPLQNGIEAARLAAYGKAARRALCVSNTVITVYPLGAVLCTVAGVWTAVAHVSPSTVNPTLLSGGLASSTQYWIYASLVAGVVTFSVSTTAPDAGLSYKTGDTSYMYVSTFSTDGGANVIVTLAASSNPQIVATVVAPTTGNSTNDALYQKILDGISTPPIVSPGIRHARCYSINGTSIVVYPLAGYFITISGVWTAVSHTVTTTLVAATVYGGALANSTRYYLYSAWVSGAQGFVISTTAPNDNLHYMTGSTDNAYVCTFITDGSGIIVPFTRSANGRYRYTEPMRALTVGANPATSYTDIQLTTWVPSWGREVCLNAMMTPNATTDTAFIKGKGVTASGYGNAAYELVCSAAGVIANVWFQFECATDASQVVQYKFTTGGAGAIFTLDVCGFSE